jgi:hypothetical protein
MNIWELKNFFDDKVAHMPPFEDMDSLDSAHIFLKLAVSYLPECSDPVIGHFEMASRGIKYDGYFLDEDSKEFHVLSLIYFDDLDNLNETKTKDAFNDSINGSFNFVKTALKGKSNISTENDIGEHIQELIDDLEDNYNVVFDFFSNINLPVEGLPTSIDFGKGPCHIEYHDGNQIVDTINADETKGLIVEFEKQYGQPLLAIKVARNDDFDVYLTSITGCMLSNVYRDHKSRLMDGNVRAYLKRTQKTNKGILQTLKDSPQDFVAYNNGISAVAAADGSDIAPMGDNVFIIKALDKMQIVNGGQTTVTIYESSRDPINLSEVVVPVKLTVLKRQNDEAELVSNIAVFANTQTAISKSDLASNKPFYKSLEALSRTIPCYRTIEHSKDEAYYWFFERANGLYNTRRRIIWNYSKSFDKQFPEKDKFSKKILAKAVMALSCEPTFVCLGNEKCFQEFNNRIENNVVIPDSQYYKDVIASLIIWRVTDKIIKKNELPIKAAVLPYTISYLSYKTKGLLDLTKIWDNQDLDNETKNAIDKISRMISAYFVSNQSINPNTLMWGRKKECWEGVKALSLTGVFGSLCLGKKPIVFFPENPAACYIDNPSNFNNSSLWVNLISWNEKTHIFSSRDVERINDIISSITISMQEFNPSARAFGKKSFLKAVQNGYMFR